MIRSRPTTANQRAARKAVAGWLDSTQNIPPRICRLPAQVVETRITVAGNTQNNKSLALAVRCIGFVRRPQFGKITPKLNGYFQPTKHPAESNPTLDDDAQAGLVPPPGAMGFMNFNQLRW
jgi:hypothetical protein